MSSARLGLRAGWAILRRDVRMFASYRLRFAAQALAVFFTTVLFFYVSRLVRGAEFATPDDYFAFVIVGLMVLELLTATLATMPAALRNELVAGTFERLVVSPLGPRAGMLAMTAFPVLLALGVGLATLVVGVAVFGLRLRWETAPLAPVALALTTLAFVPFTMLIAGAVLLFKQAGSAATFAVTGLSLSSGAFFPVALLPGWVSWVSEIQPLTPALQLTRHLLVGGPVAGGSAVAALRLAGFAAVALPLALLALGTVIERCRARGTLTEY